MVVETEKTKAEIRSEHSGVVTKCYAGEGDDLEIGANVLELDTDAKKPEGQPEKKVEEKAAAPVESAEKKPEAPAATQKTEAKPAASQAKSPSQPLPVSPPSLPKGTRSERREKMSRLRLTISKRLKDAQNTTAMLTTFQEVDMGEVMRARSELQDPFTKKHGVKLGFMSFFVKSASNALTNQPIVNALIDGNEIVYRDYVDISVAVATPTGLVVPVIRNAESLNFADVEKTIINLGNKGKHGTLTMEDMTGGTFTISNGFFIELND